MPEKSPNYKLEYFVQGSLYSAASDYRRFVTLDYNLKSYFGVVGNGVLTGWETVPLTGTTIQIMYGNGIINGFFAESPYGVKQRHSMVIPEREVEVIRFDSIPEPYMNDIQGAYYVGVIKNYDSSYPDYNPLNPIEDAYVKTVNLTTTAQLTLPSDADSYIYAEISTTHVPYPSLNDGVYPAFHIVEPEVNDYPTYSAYLTALAAFQVQYDAYIAYHWQLYDVNHYTEVSFAQYTSARVGSNRVLLAKVATRGGSITDVDYSAVFNLTNMSSLIKNNATDLLVQHQHGGNLDYDPPKVKLETDIRQAALINYDDTSRVATYNILDKNLTSIEQGHQHTYFINNVGIGQTIDTIGADKHFHMITSYVVGSSNGNPLVLSHIHTVVNSVTYVDGWTDNAYNIKADGNIIGNQSSDNIVIDDTKKFLTISGTVNALYRTYATALVVNGVTYTFSAKAFSAYGFMLLVLSDFTTRYPKQSAPFVTGVINGDITAMAMLRLQSEAADKQMVKDNDTFYYSSNIGTDITVVLVQAGQNITNSVIAVEVLGNTEVTGVLSAGNIIFVNAENDL